MRKITVAAITVAAVTGNLFVTSLSGALAQDVASLPANPKSNYLVFLDGNNRLSGPAFQTVSKAADASRRGGPIRIEGHPAQVDIVKTELLKQGVPATAIMTLPARSAPRMAADGTPNPADRYVEIKM